MKTFSCAACGPARVVGVASRAKWLRRLICHDCIRWCARWLESKSLKCVVADRESDFKVDLGTCGAWKRLKMWVRILRRDISICTTFFAGWTRFHIWDQACRRIPSLFRAPPALHLRATSHNRESRLPALPSPPPVLESICFHQRFLLHSRWLRFQDHRHFTRSEKS